MKRIGEFYQEESQGDDMMTIASHCSRFSRRHDFDTFNMSTYQSCENCRHLSADSECICGAQSRRLPF